MTERSRGNGRLTGFSGFAPSPKAACRSSRSFSAKLRMWRLVADARHGETALHRLKLVSMQQSEVLQPAMPLHEAQHPVRPAPRRQWA